MNTMSAQNDQNELEFDLFGLYVVDNRLDLWKKDYVQGFGYPVGYAGESVNLLSSVLGAALIYAADEDAADVAVYRTADGMWVLVSNVSCPWATYPPVNSV